MALISRIKTWVAGDKLTATDLNAEFTNLVDLLAGAGTETVKVNYPNADLPNLELESSGNGQNLLLLEATGTSAYGLRVNDGASNTAEITAAGNVKGTTLQSSVATGTAPLIVASETMVPNLNADMVDGVEAAELLSGTGDQTIAAATATPLVWTWQSDTSVVLNINETASAVAYSIGQLVDDLEIRETVGDTALLAFDGTNSQVEFPANVELQGNNSATIYLQADGTITPDLDNGSIQTVTLAENTTISGLSNAKIGGTYILIIKQDGTGSRTLGWGANFLFAGGTTPTVTAAANAVDIYTILAETASIFYVTSVQNLQ